MQTRWMVSGALLAALSSTYAIAGEPETLAKTSAWEMNYDDDACHLLSKFGKDRDQVLMQLTRHGPDDDLSLNLYGHRFRWIDKVTTEALIAFQPTTGKISSSRILTGNNGNSPAIFLRRIRLDNFQTTIKDGESEPIVPLMREQQVNTLFVSIRGGTAFRLALGSMKAPMEAMRKCTDNLVRTWGFDPQEIATRIRRAKPNTPLGNWLKSDDYPTGMLNKGESGLVAIRMIIKPDGNPENCTVQQATLPSELGPFTCKLLMERATFTPALSSDGKPVPDVYRTKVNWMIAQ